MKFDIILPTIGRASVFEAIDSVNKQDYPHWTLWVIGDGMKELFWPYTDGRFKLPLYGKVVGSNFPAHGDSGAWSRNEGIRLGRSEWIAYIDDDDVWLPNHLTILSECATLHPEANMLRTLGRSFSWRHKSPRSSKLVRKLGPVNSQDILTVGMAHTREIFNKTTGWQPVDNHDHILWREMLAAGGTAAIAQEVTFEFER